MTLGTRDEALGQVWHMPTAAPITGREFVQRLVAEAGTQSPVAALSRVLVQVLALVWPVARQGAELIYRFDTPYVVDAGKFRRAFASTPTPCLDGIRQTLSRYRQGMGNSHPRTGSSCWQTMRRHDRTGPERK